MRTRLGLALFVLTAPLWSQAAKQKPGTLEDKLRGYGDVLLSADGRMLVYTDNGEVMWNGRPAGTGSGLALTADGTQLALVSKDQVFVMDARGKRRMLPRLDGPKRRLQWSGDGRLAVLHTEDAKKAVGPTAAVARQVGVIGESADVQRVFVAEGGRWRAASPANLNVHEYDWSPDGKQMVLLASVPPGDNNWYVARLYVLDVAKGEVRELYQPKWQMAVPRWSPDGQHVAFLEGLMSDEGVAGGEIHVVPVSGGAARNLTPRRASTPAWLAWRDADSLLFTEHTLAGSAIGVATLEGKVERVWEAEETIGAGRESMSLAVSKGGAKIATVRQGRMLAPEVWMGAPGQWTPVTQGNRAARPSWSQVKSLTWKSDEFTVQGWLIYPKDFDPSKRYPMITVVHGGPSSVVKATFDGRRRGPGSNWEQGYFVFYPNPRGSFGQGSAFSEANRRDFGYGDLGDVLAGVDEALRVAPIDPERLGITGWSYGGYLTMFAVTQTNRFKVAVAGAGISNLISYYGQNHIDQWMIGFFGATAYDDPEIYRRSSPITFVKNVKTPTLMVVGERDGECPPPQSFEFWHALKALGVKTELVVYEGEGHGLADPKHVKDLRERSAKWFAEYLKP